MDVGVEPLGYAVRLERLGESALARVSERGVPKIVGERDRLGERLLRVQIVGQSTRDLSDLQDVVEAGPEPGPTVAPEPDPKLGGAPAVADALHLRLVLELAERRGVDDPIAIDLERMLPLARSFLPVPAFAPRRLG